MHKPAPAVAWITGGGTGIGRALALRLAAAGWTVAISGRRSGPLAETASSNPDRLRPYPLDVADLQAMRNTAARIEAELGPLTLVVLNAGIGQFLKLSEFNAEISAKHMQVNYLGVVNGLDAILPGFRQRHAGHIVVVASVAGYRGVPRAAAYGPTKAALINLVEALRFELERAGIRISVCNPGFIDTPMTADNNFPMPFLMRLDDAADRLYRGILKQKFEITFPRRLVMPLKLLRCLPYPLYFWLMRKFYFR
ncbi:MAG TPA: SDR family NAD(P)-dependent oxidoreductase [Gammaproteobacteria bacterium]|nr:SDR family NAD(P)-dependent oxidoreductase [Gammaproteobacteria bacterium]